MRRDVFKADATRREILNLLTHQSLNINTVAENFTVSQTAIYKHLKILKQCGLVNIKQQGRERYCQAQLEKLSEISDWVEQCRQTWEGQFNLLEDYLQEIKHKTKNKDPGENN